MYCSWTRVRLLTKLLLDHWKLRFWWPPGRMYGWHRTYEITCIDCSRFTTACKACKAHKTFHHLFIYYWSNITLSLSIETWRSSNTVCCISWPTCQLGHTVGGTHKGTIWECRSHLEPIWAFWQRQFQDNFRIKDCAVLRLVLEILYNQKGQTCQTHYH